MTATDQGGLDYSGPFGFEVVDVDDAPTAIELDNDTVTENLAAAVIGNLSATDPTPMDTHTFSVDDPRFEIVGNQLTLKAGESLDYESEPTVTVAEGGRFVGGWPSDRAATESTSVQIVASIGLNSVCFRSRLDQRGFGVLGGSSARRPQLPTTGHWPPATACMATCA